MASSRQMVPAVRNLRGHQQPIGSEAMVRAFGDCLSLLATVLEREDVITVSELARSLGEFATVTAVNRPEQGKILMFWAAYLKEPAATLPGSPPLH